MKNYIITFSDKEIEILERYINYKINVYENNIDNLYDRLNYAIKSKDKRNEDLINNQIISLEYEYKYYLSIYEKIYKEIKND